MINTIKWAIYYRTHEDKERSKLVFELIWNKLGCDEWGDNWTKEQEDMFYEQVDLLVPLKTENDFKEVYELVKSVFGEVEIKN